MEQLLFDQTLFKQLVLHGKKYKGMDVFCHIIAVHIAERYHDINESIAIFDSMMVTYLHK